MSTTMRLPEPTMPRDEAEAHEALLREIERLDQEIKKNVEMLRVLRGL